MTFEWPIALAALAVIPLLVLLYIARERRRTSFAARFGNPALLSNVVDRAPGALRHLPLAVLLVALTAMVVGVARPHATVKTKREEATVVLAIDVSRSMKANDVRPTRLAAAVAAAKAFLAQVPPKFRVGVVSFADRAAVSVPPTDDRDLVVRALDSLRPGEGTALGDAVVVSAGLGRRQRSSDGALPPRAVLMISDGAPDGGVTSVEEAAARARRQGVPVYTMALGTPNGVVEETLPGGFRQIIRVPPSPETLQQIARLTRGEFFSVPDERRLARVHEGLASRLGEREEVREITDWFAGGAGALLLLGGTMSAFLFRRVP